MKEKIVIIGAGDFQNPLILKAKRMGFETHVFAWKCGDIGERTADYFYPISITEKEKILEECIKIKPVAVTSISSDLAVPTVNYISRKLGLNTNSEFCDKVSTNKYEMRQALKAGGLWTPAFYRVSSPAEAQITEKLRFPVIVKPTDRSGSRAVTEAGDRRELHKAIQKAVEQSFEKKAIIEEIIDGDEYSCECISYHGRHFFLAFTKKYTTGAPNYIETGHCQPAQIPVEQQDLIKQQVFKALDALDIKNGASHCEFKIDNDGNVKIIEIGARMGGDCIGSHLVELSTGIDFVKMIIQVSMDIQPQIKETAHKAAGIRFIFNEADKAILMKIRQDPENKLVYISDIQNADNLKERNIQDSSSRYGYFIACAEDISGLIHTLHF